LLVFVFFDLVGLQHAAMPASVAERTHL
jgi:hypothetical protein